LSLPVYSDPALSAEVEALTREIIGTDADPEKQQLARRIAEAQIDLRRVRHARHHLLSQALSDPDYESEGMLRKSGTGHPLFATLRSAHADAGRRHGIFEFEAGGAAQIRNYPCR
jgi:hypothetical protein